MTRKNGNKLPAARSSIDDLPDAVLENILGLLQLHEAVRTCVLGRRWRHLWKFTTRLHITRSHPYDMEQTPVKNIREFVDQALFLRGSSPVDVCDISLSDFEDQEMPSIKNWIRHVLMCKVQDLTLRFFREACDVPWQKLDERTLVSQHLKRLKLFYLWFSEDFIDLSSCPVLEELEIHSCYLASVDCISSLSLNRLSIGYSCYVGQNFRNRIYVPNLISLHLDLDLDRVPVLEKMPFLEEAFVKIWFSECDSCFTYENCDFENCYHYYDVMIEGDNDSCVLLQGLSEAKNLALISNMETYIFRRDMKRCPVFSNLKILFLNEYWCERIDLLTSILEHSPVLEKLTLQLFCKGTKSEIEMKGSPDPKKRPPTISKHLNLVEVKCELVDKKVLNVLKYLKKFNIYLYTTYLNFEE